MDAGSGLAGALLFFDASCLIAAAGSAHGGSGVLLEICRRGWLRVAISHVVMLEAERNILAKRGRTVLIHYHQLLARTPWMLAPVPPLPIDAAWTATVNAKDHHVVAAALAIEADYLVTLDRRLIAQIRQAALPLLALDPGTVIKTVVVHLPTRGTSE